MKQGSELQVNTSSFISVFIKLVLISEIRGDNKGGDMEIYLNEKHILLRVLPMKVSIFFIP